MQSAVESVRVALSGLDSNRLRAGLTTLGIAIGVAAVIVLVSLGQAVQIFVEEQFLGIGTNLVFVVSETMFNRSGTGPPDAARVTTWSSLTDADVHALSDIFRVPSALAVIPEVRLSRVASFEGAEARGRIRATTPEYLSVRNRTIAVGRFFDERDMLGKTRVVVLGQTTVANLFPPGVSPVGETIRIGNVPFRVIGVLDKYGGTSFGDEDDLIFMPMTTAQERLESARTVTGRYPVTQILIQAASDDRIEALVAEVTQTLREEHNIAFRDEDDFVVMTQADLLQSFSAITGLLTIFLGVIAGISLLVGGIGIMNIMLVTVTERTREIGLRKAVGAKRSDILSQFLVESTVLSVIGGTAGLVVAYLGTTLIGLALPDLEARVSLSSVALATTISATIGIFFGLYPAQRASRLNPIDALRFE